MSRLPAKTCRPAPPQFCRSELSGSRGEAGALPIGTARGRCLARSGQSALPGRWVDTDELKAIAQYAARRDRLETALADAVRVARSNGRSWSQIGTMLGVSKQAAQRNYSKLVS
jgi:hypothetical protein